MVWPADGRVLTRVAESTPAGAFHLPDALRNDDRPAIDRYLSNVQPGKPLQQLESPLHLAVLCAEPQTIDYILHKPEVDPNLVEAKDGNTPLHLALKSNRLDASALLLARPDIDETRANLHGKTPVQCVVSDEAAQQLQSASDLAVDTTY